MVYMDEQEAVDELQRAVNDIFSDHEGSDEQAAYKIKRVREYLIEQVWYDRVVRR